MKKYIILVLLLTMISIPASFAQDEPKKDVSEMTKEDVMELTYDELLEMDFEDVLKLAEVVGVSLDELYEMILNKDLVSASKKVESSFESPLSTSVISYDELLTSGARSIEESLRMVPGLIVREKTNGNFDVHIRGNENMPQNHMLLYSENSISLVMIDGRPVYNYAHGGTFWETLPIGFDDIDRIEVVRGPSSALYGPNAVSGVVNIITKRAESEDLKVNANVQGGSQSTVISSLGLAKGFSDKFSMQVTGNFETMNRNTEEIYVHKANGGEGGFITKEELAVLEDPNPQNAGLLVFDPADDVNEMYPNPELAKQKLGGNAYLFFTPSDDINIDLKGGYQSSEVLTTTMGDNPSAHTGRLSNTGYVDLHAKIYGLTAQVNYMSGWQDIVRQDTGFKIDLTNLNANLEYDINLGDLNIRPGVAFQQGRYNDMPFLRYEGQGFLNGEKLFNSTALSLRIDYLLAERLRFIGALRGEKYNTNDDLYLSYQFIASYNIMDKHNIRLVYSKANRGPFLVDSYANYLWDREGRPTPAYIYFEGQENLDLLTMNMLELGYRIKPVKNIQADLEVFYNTTKNYGALYPDSLNLSTAGVPGDVWVRMKYQNIDMESAQIGASAQVSWVVNKNWLLKAYGTYQQTKVKNAPDFSPDLAIGRMAIGANAFGTGYSTSLSSARVNIENESTPKLYGGMIVNFNYNEKFNINLNTYYLSSQIYRTKYDYELLEEKDPIKIDAKIIANLKISYKVYDNASVFVNGRNILGNKQEFPYMDDIGFLLLGGLTITY